MRKAQFNIESYRLAIGNPTVGLWSGTWGERFLFGDESLEVVECDRRDNLGVVVLWEGVAPEIELEHGEPMLEPAGDAEVVVEDASNAATEVGMGNRGRWGCCALT